MKKYFIIFYLLTLVSCSGAKLGRKFDGFKEPNKDQALIYFYRPNDIAGAAIHYTVKENSVPVTVLVKGSYYPYYTEAGSKTFTARTEVKRTITLDVKNGETYFVKGTVGFGILIGRPKFEIVANKKEVLSDIRQCKISE